MPIRDILNRISLFLFLEKRSAQVLRLLVEPIRGDDSNELSLDRKDI